MARLSVRLVDTPSGAVSIYSNSEYIFVLDFNAKKHQDQILMELKDLVLSKHNESFSLGRDGVFRYQGKLFVPNIDNFRPNINV